MKHFDDEKILSSVRKNERYEIKTTSEDVLRKYRLEKVKASKKEKRKKLWPFAFGMGAVALLATSLTLTLVLLPKGDKTIPHLPSESEAFLEELSSFSFYQGKRNQLSSLKRAWNDVPNSSDSNNDTFYDAVSSFDEHFDFFSSCFHFEEGKLSTNNVVLDAPYTLEGKSYPYRSDFIYEEKPLFNIYFGDLSLLSSKKNASFDVVYLLDEKIYQVTVKKEIEEDKGEIEEELTLSFFEVGGEDIFQIEKEKEIEEDEMEHSYTLKKYLSESSFRKDNPYLSISFELEKERTASESSFEIEYQDAEYSFEKITYSENVYTFDIEGEKGTEFQYLRTTLEILNKKHIYRYESKEITFSK